MKTHIAILPAEGSCSGENGRTGRVDELAMDNLDRRPVMNNGTFIAAAVLTTGNCYCRPSPTAGHPDRQGTEVNRTRLR